MSKQFIEPNQVQAILFGYLIKNYNKVQTSKMNKYLQELNLDRMSVEDLKDFGKRIDKSPELEELVTGAIEGDITLEHLVKYGTEDVTPFKELDPYEVVTAHVTDHHRNLRNNRHFNRLRREGSYFRILTEDMLKDFKRDFTDIDTNLFPVRDEEFEIKIEGSSLIVTLADTHVGKVVNHHPDIGVGYSYVILVERLATYLEEIRKMAKLTNVDNIRFYFLGDAIENADMRNDQSFHAEFDTSEQITKATRAILDFLTQLEGIAPVKAGFINGNHDRLTGTRNKKDKIYNDSAVYVILDTLFMLQDIGALKNTELIDNREAMHILSDTVNGKKVICLHGDHLKGTKPISTLGIDNVSLLLSAHKHHLHYKQEDGKAVHVQVGSIVGNDDYASEHMFSRNTAPTQTMIVVNDKNFNGMFTYSPYLD